MIVHIIFSLAIGRSEHLVADIVNQQCLQRRVMLIIINNKMDELDLQIRYMKERGGGGRAGRKWGNI